jgi:USP8 dimerisation domain
LIEAAEKTELEGDEERSYLHYVKCNLVLGYIKKHPDYSKEKMLVEKVVGYNEAIVMYTDIIGELKRSLEKRYKEKCSVQVADPTKVLNLGDSSRVTAMPNKRGTSLALPQNSQTFPVDRTMSLSAMKNYKRSENEKLNLGFRVDTDGTLLLEEETRLEAGDELQQIENERNERKKIEGKKKERKVTFQQTPPRTQRLSAINQQLKERQLSDQIAKIKMLSKRLGSSCEALKESQKELDKAIKEEDDRLRMDRLKQAVLEQQRYERNLQIRRNERGENYLGLPKHTDDSTDDEENPSQNRPLRPLWSISEF